jgi:two-component system phosphate regulon sensor histidine kinase PhoR
MLNSLEKGAAQKLVPLPSAFSRRRDTDVEDSGVIEAVAVTAQSPVTRLFGRRWLILLFAAIVFVLAVKYGMPWYAQAVSLVVFAGGAAVIPRSRLSPVLRPIVVSSKPIYEAKDIASPLIGALPDPAILLDQDGSIVSFNEKARDLFGGLKLDLHLSSAIRNPQVLDAVRDCSADRPVQTVAFTDRVPVERHMSATVSHVDVAPATRAPFVLLFLRDLTEQRRLDQLRSDFIANASHEIKTPLASLVGFIETLQGAARHDEGARERFLAIMAKQAERMARLIDNLMSLSRVEMHAHLKPQDPVVVADLVRQACEALEPMAAEANIKVLVQSSADGAVVQGDRDELIQVFINLLHNALKYGRPGGSVNVSVERRQTALDRMIAVTVADDGPGIPSQHLPRLTERFYRVPSASAFEKGGTGLGLAIVKHVINRHRGELQIQSEEGAGSTFTVLLTERKLSVTAGREHSTR